MIETKPLGKSFISLLGSFLAGNVMCLLSIAMFSVLLDSTVGKMLLQLGHFLIMFVAMYPFFYEYGCAVRLHEDKLEQQQLIGKLKKLIGMFYCIPFGSLVFLILMKLQVVPDVLYFYKIANVPFWGTLMIMMESITILNVTWIAIGLVALLPLMYLLIILSGFVFGYQNVTVRGLLRQDIQRKKEKK